MVIIVGLRWFKRGGTDCSIANDGTCPVAVVGGVVNDGCVPQDVGLVAESLGVAAAAGGAGKGSRCEEKAGDKLGGNHSDKKGGKEGSAEVNARTRSLKNEGSISCSLYTTSCSRLCLLCHLSCSAATRIGGLISPPTHRIVDAAVIMMLLPVERARAGIYLLAPPTAMLV